MSVAIKMYYLPTSNILCVAYLLCTFNICVYFCHFEYIFHKSVIYKLLYKMHNISKYAFCHLPPEIGIVSGCIENLNPTYSFILLSFKISVYLESDCQHI